MVRAHLLIALLLNATAAFSQHTITTNHFDSIRIDPDLNIGHLANGLTYYLRRTPESKQISMRLVVKTGTCYELEHEYEFAHLVEHMAFEGTTHFPGDSMLNYTSKHGLAFGDEFTAGTAGTHTHFDLTIPSNDTALFQTSMKILRDWTQDFSFDPERVNAQRGAVLGEMRMGSAPVYSTYGEIQSTIEATVLNRNLHSIDYTKKCIENLESSFNYSQLIQFYKKWYRADLEAIIIVGDVDISKTEKQVHAMFNTMQKPALIAPDTAVLKAKWAGTVTGANRSMVFTHRRLSDTEIKFYLKKKHPSENENSAQYYRQLIFDQLLNELLATRIQQIHAAYSVPFKQATMVINRNLFDPFSNVDAFITSINVDNAGNLSSAFKRIVLELERIRRLGFNAEEFRRVQEHVLRAQKTEETEASVQLGRAYTDHFVFNKIPLSPDDYRELMIHIISTTTLAEINKCAASWIDLYENRDVVMMAPPDLKPLLPDEETIDHWIKKTAGQQHIDIMQPEPMISQLMDNNQSSLLNSTTTSFQQQQLDQTGLTRIRIKKGPDIILFPSKTKGHTIDFLAYSKGGSSRYNDSLKATAAYAASIMANGGVGLYNKFQVSTFFASRGIRVNPYIDETSENVVGSCPSAELETFLQAVHLYFTAPRLDQVALNDWKSAKLTQIKTNETSKVMFDNLLKTSVENSYRPTKHEIAAITVENVLEVYRQRYSNSGDFTFFLTGDFQIDSIRDLLLKYLGTIPAKGPKEHALKTKGYRRKQIDTTIYTGPPAKAEIRLLFPAKRDYKFTIKNNLLLELLREGLRDRVFDRLRTREGGAYSPQAFLNYNLVTKKQGDYRFGIWFDCAPDNTDNMINLALEEFRNLRLNGFDPVLFAKAMATEHNDLKTRMNYGISAALLKELYMRGLIVDNYYEQPKILDSITIQDVNHAARHFLTEAHLQKFIMMPEM